MDEEPETSCATQCAEELKVFQIRFGTRELSVHIKGPPQVLMAKE